MLSVGEKIRYFRKQRRMTQDQLALQSGIHPVSIRKYETNKMQPQLPQIERIAEVLQVNASAITGFNSSDIRFETVGDLMGLLLSWHKAGILTIQGKRDENGTIQMETAHLVPSPVLGHYVTLLVKNGKKEKAIDWDSFHLEMPGYALLRDLLKWERFYAVYVQSAQGINEETDEEIRKNFEALENTLELIEMELQSSQVQLSFPEDE